MTAIASTRTNLCEAEIPSERYSFAFLPLGVAQVTFPIETLKSGVQFCECRMVDSAIDVLLQNLLEAVNQLPKNDHARTFSPTAHSLIHPQAALLKTAMLSLDAVTDVGNQLESSRKSN